MVWMNNAVRHSGHEDASKCAVQHPCINPSQPSYLPQVPGVSDGSRLQFVQQQGDSLKGADPGSLRDPLGRTDPVTQTRNCTGAQTHLHTQHRADISIYNSDPDDWWEKWRGKHETSPGKSRIKFLQQRVTQRAAVLYVTRSACTNKQQLWPVVEAKVKLISGYLRISIYSTSFWTRVLLFTLFVWQH